MGHTLAEWNARTLLWLHDVNELDVQADSVVNDIGIPAALAQYGRDRGSVVSVIELAGNGTSYYTLPGFDDTTATVYAVEYPARQNPPRYLDGSLWTVGRSVADVSVTQLVLYGAAPVAAQYVRVTIGSFGPLPYPTSVASVDLVPAELFVFVTALAASYCCTQLLSEAARDRQAAIPTDFAEGQSRALMLQQTADRLMNVYRMALGLAPVGAAGGVPTSPAGPAYGRRTFSSWSGSMFHRGP